MRVLIIHNYYQRWGGSDQAAEEDYRLLEQNGDTVRLYSSDNDEIEDYSLARKGQLFFSTTWSVKSNRSIKDVIEEFSPDIAHFHNHFPLISPSAYYACDALQIPVIQTLHDYRLFCPLGWFFRDGKPCEECVQHSLLRSIWHACYHDSRLQTSSIAMMLAIHRKLGTWNSKVNMYIALTDFVRKKLVHGGIPANKVAVRPNYLAYDPGHKPMKRNFALFVGRLSHEKGIVPLLEAWRRGIEIPLKIAGSGPLSDSLGNYLQQHNIQNVEQCGFQPVERILSLMREAYFVVVPSLTYELMPKTIVEAYAVGTPVIASDLGSLSTLVEHERTGLLFDPGDSVDLMTKISFAMSNLDRLHKWGEAARGVFEREYTPEVAYRSLIDIYKQVM